MQESGAPARLVPTIYRFWIPVLATAAMAVLGQLGYPLGYEFARDSLHWLESEDGAVELGTVVVLGIAIFYGLRAIPLARRKAMKPLAVWIALNTLAVFYFFGEELSWGQHLFGWGTPDWVGAHNDQNETNLHNMSSWLDQKPRLLVYLGIVFGGIVVPILRRRRPGADWLNGPIWIWIWPTIDTLTSAVLVAVIRGPEKIFKALGVPNDSPFRFYLDNFRTSELQELLIACFFLVYLYAIWRRLRDGTPRAG